MKYHKWLKMGADIYQCQKCGVYRCHALTDFSSAPGRSESRKRLVDIEFSTVSGIVIARNPSKQPPCEEGIYA